MSFVSSVSAKCFGKFQNITLTLILIVCCCTLPIGDAQTIPCQTARNESARCVPAPFCEITLKLTKTTSVTGLSVRQLSVRYCGTLVSTAYVCCPLDQIINIPDDTTPKIEFDGTLNKVGLGILKSTQCGTIDKDTYINGIKEAEALKFPWIVRLQNEKGTPLCVGTLITNQYVLTTAHCSSDSNIKIAHIDATVNGTQNSALGIDKLITHEDWKNGNDIGLIRLDRTLVFYPHIQPICLPITPVLASYKMEIGFLVGKDIGKGKTKTFVITTQSAENSSCVSRKNKAEMCVDCHEDEECQIGAGSPLFFPAIYLETTRYVEFYILWGGVAKENFYTKVAPYMQWITEKLKP